MELMAAFTQKSLHLAAEMEHILQSVLVHLIIFVQGLEMLSLSQVFKRAGSSAANICQDTEQSNRTDTDLVRHNI